MKFIKHLTLTFVILFSANNSRAAIVSGVGCNLGNTIYTFKLGTTNWFGTNIDVYSTTTKVYNINWDNTSQCDQINANQVGKNGNECWINSYVNPTNNNSNIGHGSLATYTVNTCPQVNLPLDNYTWVLIVIIGGFGAYGITRKELINS
jgi:hypothetical protein